MGAAGDSRAGGGPGVVWAWADAWPALLYAAPAAVAALSDPGRGAALAIGVLPAALLGMPARRRARLAVAIVGILAGAAMLVGSTLAATPVLAVVAMFGFGVGSAWGTRPQAGSP
jgi:hypothetical protein